MKREPAVCDLREMEGRLGWAERDWAFAEWGADKPTGEGTGEGETEREEALKSEMESGRAATCRRGRCGSATQARTGRA